MVPFSDVLGPMEKLQFGVVSAVTVVDVIVTASLLSHLVSAKAEM